MRNLHGRTKNLQPQDYLSVTREFNRQFTTAGPETFIGNLDSRTRLDFATLGVEVATLITPIDRSAPNHNAEYRKKIANGIAKGALTGYFLAKAAYAPIQVGGEDLEFPDLSLTGKEDEDELRAKHDTAVAYIEYGWKGVRLTGAEVESILEEWESALDHDIRTQQYFRVGAGIVLKSLDEKFSSLLGEDMERLRREAESGKFDETYWDAEIAKLLN